MMQDFDKIIPREGTNTYKYDLREKLFGTNDVYPMWVADTEFRAPDFIIDVLQKRIDHGVFGYTILDDEYFQSIINWGGNQHGWKIEKDWIRYSPGVVPSLFASVLSFTDPGDKVIIQTPVYHPFYYAVNETGRELVRNPLRLSNGRYEMDFEGLKQQIDNKTKMLILCNPHNPTGNVWKEEELRELCSICLENNILIISDEIHADIVYPGHKHIPTAMLSEEIAQNTITLMAPSKTFNIAGLNSSYIIAQNMEFLKRITWYFEGLHIGPNIFAIEATKAAYNHGSEWLKELLAYYLKNINSVKDFLANKMPEVMLVEPEGTFLLWLDFRAMKLKRKDLLKKLHDEAKIGLSDGFMFGKEGDGFQRMNIGCANSEILKALEAISKAFEKKI